MQEDPFLGHSSFSLSPGTPSPPEGRLDPHILSVLRAAKLITEDGEDLCRIRNISGGGMMAETGSPRAAGETVAVELHAGHRVRGRILWARGNTIGIEFCEGVNIWEALARIDPTLGRTARPPRVQAPCTASVRLGTHFHMAPVRDISQGGIKIAVDVEPCAGEEAAVLIPGLRTFTGVVRWCDNGHVGIAFDQAIPFDELANWLGTEGARHLQAADRRSRAV